MKRVSSTSRRATFLPPAWHEAGRLVLFRARGDGGTNVCTEIKVAIVVEVRYLPVTLLRCACYLLRTNINFLRAQTTYRPHAKHKGRLLLTFPKYFGDDRCDDRRSRRDDGRDVVVAAGPKRGELGGKENDWTCKSVPCSHLLLISHRT